MKRLIIKLVFILFLCLVADFILGNILKYKYFSLTSGEYYLATKSINVQKSDLVILGSSRAKNHYNPDILEDSLQLSSYNMGRSGCFILYQSAQFQMLLERHIPKMVILDIVPYDFERNQSDYDRLSLLLPYRNRHISIVDKFLKYRSNYETAKVSLSNIYPYNGMILALYSSASDQLNYLENGFQPLKDTFRGVYGKREPSNARLDSTKVNEFKEIINLCKRKSIELYICISPFYADYPSNPTISTAAEIAKENGIPFISFLNNEKYLDDSLFATNDHLNANGANLYTSDIANWIKKIRNSNQTYE